MERWTVPPIPIPIIPIPCLRRPGRTRFDDDLDDRKIGPKGAMMASPSSLPDDATRLPIRSRRSRPWESLNHPWESNGKMGARHNLRSTRIVSPIIVHQT